VVCIRRFRGLVLVTLTRTAWHRSWDRFRRHENKSLNDCLKTALELPLDNSDEMLDMKFFSRDRSLLTPFACRGLGPGRQGLTADRLKRTGSAEIFSSRQGQGARNLTREVRNSYPVVARAANASPRLRPRRHNQPLLMTPRRQRQAIDQGQGAGAAAAPRGRPMAKNRLRPNVDPAAASSSWDADGGNLKQFGAGRRLESAWSPTARDSFHLTPGEDGFRIYSWMEGATSATHKNRQLVGSSPLPIRPTARRSLVRRRR